MLDYLSSFYSSLTENAYMIFLICLLGLYVVYYRLMSYSTVRMSGDYPQRLKNMGRTLPPFPNGWYIACKSKEIGKGEIKAIDIAGRQMVIFRNAKGEVYGLETSC